MKIALKYRLCGYRPGSPNQVLLHWKKVFPKRWCKGQLYSPAKSERQGDSIRGPGYDRKGVLPLPGYRMPQPHRASDLSICINALAHPWIYYLSSVLWFVIWDSNQCFICFLARAFSRALWLPSEQSDLERPADLPLHYGSWLGGHYGK